MAVNRAVLGLVVACVAVTMLAPAVAAASTWHVSSDSGIDQASCGVGTGTDACATLDYAINKAAEGDTVTAAHGKYGITQAVEKSITIRGEGRCVAWRDAGAATPRRSQPCAPCGRAARNCSHDACGAPFVTVRVCPCTGGCGASGSTPSSRARPAERSW